MIHAKPYIEDPYAKDLHQLFHKLWTKAVGTDGYNKSEWKQLERMIERLHKV